MKLSRFQYSLAYNSVSLSIIVIALVVVWIIVGGSNPMGYDSQWGIWPYLPEGVKNGGWFNSLLALLIVSVSVYTLSELNISNVLLRINSRIISITFAALVLVAISLHSFHSGWVIMFLMLLSYFSLFRSYQLENSASLIYVSFLYVGIAILAFPKIVWIIPIYWLTLYILRTANSKSVCASVLGLLTPLWIIGSIAFCKDKMDDFWNVARQVYTFEWGGYSTLSSIEAATIGLFFIIFIIGVVDFYTRAYLDKTRIRILYYCISIHGFAIYLLFLLQPMSYNAFMPPAILITSLMAGHYVANNHTSLSNIITIVITVMLTLLFVLSVWIQ